MCGGLDVRTEDKVGKGISTKNKRFLLTAIRYHTRIPCGPLQFQLKNLI